MKLGTALPPNGSVPRPRRRETVYALEQRLQTAKPAHKLPAWYLLDALAKAAGAPARKALEEALPDLIVKHMDFEHPTLNEKCAAQMEHGCVYVYDYCLSFPPVFSTGGGDRFWEGVCPPTPGWGGVAIPFFQPAAAGLQPPRAVHKGQEALFSP